MNKDYSNIEQCEYECLYFENIRINQWKIKTKENNIHNVEINKKLIISVVKNNIKKKKYLA